jgi:hypothetical protein
MRALRLLVGAGLIITAAAIICTAQSGVSITGPSIGFISDEEGRTIRPLLGVLGASIPGDALKLPEGIVQGTISPRQDYALAKSAANGQPVVVHLNSPDLAIVPLAGRPADSEWVATSPTGTAAALYGKESHRLQVVSGLPAMPEVVFEFDTSVLGGMLRSIAVSDDAKLALVNIGGQVRTLWILNGNGNASPVSATLPSQMTFIANRHDALIADDGTHEVFLLQNLDDNPVRLPGLVLRDSERAISAVAASADGQTIFVAQDGSTEITLTDLQTRITSVVSCPCTPTVFAPMQGTAVFRLNSVSKGPLAILDASPFPGQPPRTLVIPIDLQALAREGTAQ